MNYSLIAKRYANALLGLSIEMNVLEKIKKDIDLFVSVCKSNKDLRLLLKSPIIKPDKKMAILKDIFEGNIHKISLAYFMIITRKRREPYLIAIAEQFIILYKQYKNILTVHLQTAEKINNNIRESIIGLLKKHTKVEIELIEEIRKEIIGGFILKYEDNKYDASISSELLELKQAIAEFNLYERKF